DRARRIILRAAGGQCHHHADYREHGGDSAPPQPTAIDMAASHQRLLIKSASAAVLVHSTTTLAASITGPHVSTLCRIKPRISSGVLASGSASSARMRPRNCGSRNPCRIACDTFLVISPGVPGGAAT